MSGSKKNDIPYRRWMHTTLRPASGILIAKITLLFQSLDDITDPIDLKQVGSTRLMQGVAGGYDHMVLFPQITFLVSKHDQAFDVVFNIMMHYIIIQRCDAP